MFALSSLLIANAVSPGPEPIGFRGDSSHRGVYESRAPLTAPALKWKFPTKGKVISSPAVTGGVVYVGSTDGRLYAVEVATGKEKWRFATEGRVVSSPAVSGGSVYVNSYDGRLYAVDIATGMEKWRFETKGERRYAAPHIHGMDPQGETMPDPFDFYMSSPVVSGGTVYFGSGDTNIYAVDAVTGKEKWHHKTGDVVHASPAVSDGVVFVGSWDTWFYALDAATGDEKWKFKSGEDKQIYNQIGFQSSPAVSGGVVYVGCRDSNFYALDAKTGAKKWVYPNHGSWVITSPAVADGLVFFATSDTHLLRAVNATDGKDVFKLDLKWPMFSSPALAGGTLLIGTHGGKLQAVDLGKREATWAFETDGWKANGAAWTKPDGTFNAQKAYASPFYDDIVAGINTMFSLGSVLSSPVVVEGVAYFGSTDGNLYAVK